MAPKYPTMLVGLAAGGYHTAALTSSGRLLAWGRDEHGQCSRIPSLGERETFIGVAAGGCHTAALISSGRLLAWGWDYDGQCSRIPSLEERETFIGVAAGEYHTAALTSSGRLLAWGKDADGQCSKIPSLEKGETFIGVAAGDYHTAALTSSGRLLAWGGDEHGQCSRIPSLGEGETFAGIKETLKLVLAGSAHPHVCEALYKRLLVECGMTKLHVAALLGDVGTCMLQMQGGALARKKDSNGKTAMDLAFQEGHTEVTTYLKQFSHISTMRGGSGNAVEAALADTGYIQRIKWYTLKMDHGSVNLGIQHSLLAVTVAHTDGTHTYTIEKALLDDVGSTNDRFKNGVFVSDWLEVSACFEVDTPYKCLDRSSFSAEGNLMTMRSLYTLAVEMGPYDVGTCNGHHAAMHLYNACAHDLAKVSDMPNSGWTNLARALGGFIDLNWMHSSPARSTGLATVPEGSSSASLAASQKTLQTTSHKVGVLSQSASNVITASAAAGAEQVKIELAGAVEPCSEVLERSIDVMERTSEAFEWSQQVEKTLEDLLGEDHVLPISDWLEALAEHMPMVKQVAGILKAVHAKHKGRADVQKKLAKLVEEIQQIQNIEENMENQEVKELLSGGLQRVQLDLKAIVSTSQILTPEDCITTIEGVAKELQSVKTTCLLMLAGVENSTRKEQHRNQQRCCVVL